MSSDHGGKSATAPENRRVREHVVAVAASLNTQLAGLVAEMRGSLATQIVELDNDPSLLTLLGSSIEGNVDTIVHALQHDISGDGFEPPAAAVEYARRLAQWGVPVNALVRAYRLGQQFLLARAFEASMSVPAPETVRVRANAIIVDSVFDYIDWISQRVVAVYETERESWLADRESARLDAVLDILTGHGDVEVLQRVTGYRVQGRHLALVAWSADPAARRERLQRFTMSIRALAAELGSTAAPLVVVRDGATAWAWIQLPPTEAVTTLARTLDRLSEAPPTDDAPRFALGTIASGVAGFIRSHRQALRTHRVAVLGQRDRPLERYDQPGLSVVDLCAHDPDALRQWVRSVLGDDLAADNPNAHRLRETLRIYLACDRSLNAAATAMTMHKNSIRYRVDNAEKLLPQPLATDRLAVEVALAACHWLAPRLLS